MRQLRFTLGYILRILLYNPKFAFPLILYVLDTKMYEYGIYVKMNRDFACNGPHIQIPSISCLDKTNIRWKRTTKYMHVKTNFMLMLHAR